MGDWRRENVSSKVKRTIVFVRDVPKRKAASEEKEGNTSNDRQGSFQLRIGNESNSFFSNKTFNLYI